MATGTGHRGSKRRGQGLQRDGDCSGKAPDIARRRGDKHAATEKKTEVLEREKHPAKTVVTAQAGKEKMPRAVVRCLATSPCVVEAEGGDGSCRSAKEKSVASSEVCCISFG